MSSPPSTPNPIENAGVAAEPERLTPWRARTLRRAAGADLAYCAGVLALAALTLWSGNAAGRHLSPEGAKSVARLLDDLELPRNLPNALLARDDGTETRLWEVATAPRTIITFYAPWCGPCQEELPTLVKGTSAQPDRLAVVVGPDEEAAEVRKKLDNLGLKDLRFHVDARRELEAGGRVTALPTTFLIGRMGRVQERVVGYSGFRLQMLIFKATTGEMPSFGEDGR